MDTPRLATLTAVLFMLGGQLLGAESKHGFRTDFEAAVAEAAATNRPLLIHFYADYCPPCRRMEAEVFPDVDLQQKVGQLVVAVKVNTANRQDLARKYGVDRIPHDRVIAPNGKELTRGGGFMNKWTYLSLVEGAAKQYALIQPRVVVPRKTTSAPKASVQPKVAKPKSPTPKSKLSHDTVGTSAKVQAEFVNLDGYCPVELGMNRKWIKGNQLYPVEYKGLNYHISSKANLDLFVRDPERYAPQVLGCDPVVLSSSQRAVPGRTDYGAFFDGKLYLFKTNASRTTFKQNPLKYVRIQHALDASKIERTVVR